MHLEQEADQPNVTIDRAADARLRVVVQGSFYRRARRGLLPEAVGGRAGFARAGGEAAV